MYSNFICCREKALQYRPNKVVSAVNSPRKAEYETKNIYSVHCNLLQSLVTLLVIGIQPNRLQHILSRSIHLGCLLLYICGCFSIKKIMHLPLMKLFWPFNKCKPNASAYLFLHLEARLQSLWHYTLLSGQCHKYLDIYFMSGQRLTIYSLFCRIVFQNFTQLGLNEADTFKSSSILIFFIHSAQNLYTNEWLDANLN